MVSIILSILIIAVIICLFILFAVFSYLRNRRRRILYESERLVLMQQHKNELLNQKLLAQQQTMQHIGREIHDSVGQKLTLASLYAKQIELSGNLDARSKLKDIGLIIDESLSELRHLSKSLSDPSKFHDNLAKLISDEAKRINSAGICFISIVGTGIDSVIPPYETNIFFRILQEFIQNSLKHADCRRITIVIDMEGEELQICVADDGKGFDTAVVSDGIGLQNMKRRAAQINANFQLTSIAGEGTILKLQWKP